MMESIQRPVYTDDERIRRVWDKEEIQNLMGRRAYYDANGMRRRELDELWVAKPENRATASLGRNWGYYVGMDSISAYYVARHDEARWENLRRYSQAKPEIRCCAENLGYGCMSMYTVTTPVVVISGDGKTARGLWYSMAQETTGEPDGSAEALWICEKQAVDFINEDGQWKIWHMILANDFYSPVGKNFGDEPVYYDKDEDKLRREFGHPDIALLVHDPIFNWCDNYPPMPEEYFTYSLKDSYAPEAHPGFGKQDVIADYKKYLERARREKDERKA